MPETNRPTIIVVHPKERRSKCSVAHLRGEAGYCFWKYPRVGPEPLDNYVRLGFGGPVIGPDDCASGLLILDGTWRYAERMENSFAHVPVRSLPPYMTAYPRVSKIAPDPDQGLATIEALYAAYYLMGRPVDGLLNQYSWGDEFLQLNASQFS